MQMAGENYSSEYISSPLTKICNDCSCVSVVFR